MILALDQAFHVSGWAVFSPQGQLVAHGKYKSEDLAHFRSIFSSLLEKYEVDKVYYEGIYANLNLNTYKVLAHVQGVVISTCQEKGVSAQEVYPSTWKSAFKIKGKRAQQKREAQQVVLDKYSIKATQDESDAILLGASQFLSAF